MHTPSIQLQYNLSQTPQFFFTFTNYSTPPNFYKLTASSTKPSPLLQTPFNSSHSLCQPLPFHPTFSTSRNPCQPLPTLPQLLPTFCKLFQPLSSSQLPLHLPRCESLAELIWSNRQQIKKVELLCAQLPIDMPPGRTDLLPMLNTTITGLLSALVTRFDY